MEDTVKCPYCNDNMALGYIQSPGIIIWSKNKHKVSFLPDETQGDVLVKRQDFLGSYKLAYHCPNCGTIIIRNENGNEHS